MWNFMSCNSITEQRMRKKSYDQHLNRLRRVKSKVQISKPQQPWFIYQKKKKQLNRNDELKIIQNANQFLLAKLQSISNRQNMTFQSNSFVTSLNSKTFEKTNKQMLKENRRICGKILTAQSAYKTAFAQNFANIEKSFQLNSSKSRYRAQSAKLLTNSKQLVLSRPCSGQSKNTQAAFNQVKFRQRLENRQTMRNHQNKRLIRPASASSIANKRKIFEYEETIESQK